MNSDARSYQRLLRSLGAYLDEQPTCRITVAELSDGFLVRMQRTLHKLEPQVDQFTLQDLLNRPHEGRSESDRTSRPRHQGIWSSFPNSHQDFFRALGYELDQSRAHNILVDELEDGMVITYFAAEQEGSLTYKKHLVRLGMSDIETILNEAFARRGQSTDTTP